MSTQQSHPMIIAEDIYKSFGSVKALEGVSIQVHQGQVLGLLGPNGAGKTTLVRILTTLLKPDSGKAYIAGVNVLKTPHLARQLIGLSGQYPAVDELLTGRENLEMIGQLYHFSRREAKARAQELLQQFDLIAAAGRPVNTYSGGMRRRLDLAASIVARPQVLLLDEPTTGLDPRTRIDLWGAIRELVNDGTTLLLTTQYLEEADKLADGLVLIDHGKIIAEGTSSELKAQLSGDVIELHLNDRTLLSQAATLLEPVGRQSPQIVEEDTLLSVPVHNGAESLVDVVRILDQAAITIADVNLTRPSLDDVFLRLTDS